MKQHKVCIITSRDENGWTRDATLYLDGKQWLKEEWTDETQISRMLWELAEWYEKAGHIVLEKHVHQDWGLRLLAANYVIDCLIDDSKEIMDKAPQIYTGTITTKEIGEAL